MEKTIKAELYKCFDDEHRLSFPESKISSLYFCGTYFRRACPVLAKGLRIGQTRELILTQTKYGIKLELAKKERK